jgi:hypothetical protein
MPQTTKKNALKPGTKKVEPAAPVKPAATPGHGYLVGSVVSHPMFGEGTVAGVDDNKLTIRFKDGRVKLIMAAFVKRRDR